MTTASTRTALHHIRELIAAEHTGQLTDGELLERFAKRREEAAFAVLVRRYGPLVLGVCRRVLHNRHAAEDAFQATFLTLAQHAGSVGRRGTLGGWLHRVAYRAAVRARGQARKRQEQERHAEPRTADDPLAELTGRELLALLDEQIQQLPDEQREPLILCYLEGRTRDEAARELGCSLGTLKRRLERAREALRQRLTARGAVLPATLVAAAAVPATLAAAAIRIAMAEGTAPAAVAELAAGALGGASAAKVKAALILILALGASLLGAAALVPRSPATPPPAEIAAPGPKQPERAEVRAAKPDSADRKELTVKGSVRGPDDKPFADARVMVWCRQGLVLSSGEWWASFRNEVLGQATTDKDGRFRLTVPRAEADINMRSVRVVVSVPGYALAWKALDPDAAEAEAEVRLAPVQRVSGHLIGLQGEDAAGVTVHVTRIKRTPHKGERDDDTVLRPTDDRPLSAKTDAKGNFVFTDFGPDMTVDLEVRDPRYERHDFQVNTADKKACENIRVLLGPGRVVEGRVVYQDTGKPVPHAFLMLDSPVIEAKTDAEGRLQVALYNPRESDPFPFISRDIRIQAFPPAGKPYLGAAQGVDFPKGVVRREIKLALPRGLLLRGKVTEAGSGKPVAGARVAYHAGYDRSVASGPDGSSQLGVAPGGGRLLVSHPSGEYIPMILGSAGGDLDKPVGDPIYHDAVLLGVEVTKDEKVKEVNVTFRRGVTVKGRLVGPDDKPIASAVMFVSSHRPRFETSMHPVLVRGDRFEVRGLDPEKTYRLLFLEHPRLPSAMVTPESLQGLPQLYMQELLGPQTKLGMSVEVSPKKVREDLTVELAPCAKAKVRFVDDKGKPLAGYIPWLQLVVTPGPRIYQALADKTLAAEVVSLTGRYGGQLSAFPADAQGYVTFEGLIPGATYRLKKTDQEPNNEVIKDFSAETGETLELEVVVK